MSLNPEHRRQLARRARREGTRFLLRPFDWEPDRVQNPEDNEPFTTAGAWEFIAELLENTDHPIGTVTLHSPPACRGQVAYYILTPVANGIVYIKFHEGSRNTIIGRSFHISDYRDQR